MHLSGAADNNLEYPFPFFVGKVRKAGRITAISGDGSVEEVGSLPVRCVLVGDRDQFVDAMVVTGDGSGIIFLTDPSPGEEEIDGVESAGPPTCVTCKADLRPRVQTGGSTLALSRTRSKGLVATETSLPSCCNLVDQMSVSTRSSVLSGLVGCRSGAVWAVPEVVSA